MKRSILRPCLSSTAPMFRHIFPRNIIIQLGTLLHGTIGAGSATRIASLTSRVVGVVRRRGRGRRRGPRGNRSNGGRRGTNNGRPRGDRNKDNGSRGRKPSTGNNSRRNGSRGRSSTGKGSSPGKRNSRNGSSASNNDGTKRDRTNNGSSTTGRSTTGVLRRILGTNTNSLHNSTRSTLGTRLGQITRSGKSDDCVAIHSTIGARSGPTINGDLMKSIGDAASGVEARLCKLIRTDRQITRHGRQSKGHISTQGLRHMIANSAHMFLGPRTGGHPGATIRVLISVDSSVTCGTTGKGRHRSVTQRTSLTVSVTLRTVPNMGPTIAFFNNGQGRPIFDIIGRKSAIRGQTNQFKFGTANNAPVTRTV